MQRIDYQPYLRVEQYRDATNLDARISLHQRFSRNRYGLPRWLFNQVEASGKLFEIGCGSGNIWQANNDRIPADWQLTLCDFSPGMLRQAQHNLAKSGVTAQYLVADAQALPVVDAAFDTAFAHFMLYHVPDRKQALSELRRILKPGGRLYAATNGQQHMRELYNLAEQFDPHFTGWRSSAAETFMLENGVEQLAAYFENVTLLPYDDALVVTDPAAVVSYIGSFAPLSERQQQDFLAFVTDALAQQGGTLHVTKASGVFIAV